MTRDVCGCMCCHPHQYQSLGAVYLSGLTALSDWPRQLTSGRLLRNNQQNLLDRRPYWRRSDRRSWRRSTSSDVKDRQYDPAEAKRRLTPCRGCSIVWPVVRFCSSHFRDLLMITRHRPHTTHTGVELIMTWPDSVWKRHAETEESHSTITAPPLKSLPHSFNR